MYAYEIAWMPLALLIGRFTFGAAAETAASLAGTAPPVSWKSGYRLAVLLVPAFAATWKAAHVTL